MTMEITASTPYPQAQIRQPALIASTNKSISDTDLARKLERESMQPNHLNVPIGAITLQYKAHGSQEYDEWTTERTILRCVHDKKSSY